MTLNLLVAGLLFTPLAWAVVSLLISFRAGRWLAGAGMALQAGVALGLLGALAGQGGLEYALGDWAPPLGIALRADGPALTLVLLTTLVASACGLHAAGYLDSREPGQRYFWPLFWFLWAGLNGLWLAGDIFSIYVGLELVTLAAVGLVALSGEPPALRAALRYLLAALVGSLAFLMGVALLYGAYGTLSVRLLAEAVQADGTGGAALALMFAGLAVKTALFPVHGWLPPAHSIARAPVSALLSALVIKASAYVAVRLWLDLGLVLGTRDGALLLGGLGAAAIIWGSWMAWCQTRLKMLVAYSSVSQLGYIFLLFPLTFEVADRVAELATQGVMLHMISHALAKAALFLAAGNLILAVGDGRIVALAGAGRYLPLSLFGFGLAGVSIMGLPPSGGFTAKWLLLQAAWQSAQWGWALVVLVGGLLSALYVFKVFAACYVERDSGDDFHYPSRWQDLMPLGLAGLALALGLVAGIPLNWMGIGGGA
jgi:multicomponent Na+:H+ antiporter subunit D